jgi:hypothetical protein
VDREGCERRRKRDGGFTGLRLRILLMLLNLKIRISKTIILLLVLYVYQTSSLILKDGHRLRVKNAVFWDVTPCGSCKNRRFGGT